MAATMSASAPNRPEQRVDEHVRVSGEGVGVGAGERAHPVEGVEGPVRPVQGAGEQLEQAPADEGADGHGRDQRGGRLEQRAAPHLRPELVAGQDEEADGRDVEAESDHLADVVQEPVSLPATRSTTFQTDRGDHVEDEDPPGDPLACRERRREQGQHERPREAGVGEVEDVVVDELARHPDDQPDQRGHAGDQGQRGDDADGPARRDGDPPERASADSSSPRSGS